LSLSPNHALYVDGQLIPVRLLINGTSIASVPVHEISYYHIELEHHDVLLAEGMPVESWLDNGDRGDFANSDEPMTLFPAFARPVTRGATVWETKGCAPLVLHGPVLERVRCWVNRLAQRNDATFTGRPLLHGLV
jgi:hypothetical protein